MDFKTQIESLGRTVDKWFQLGMGHDEEGIQNSIDLIDKTRNWDAVRSSDVYKDLPVPSRPAVQRYFRDNIIQTSSKFTSLSKEKQLELLDSWDDFAWKETLAASFDKPAANYFLVKGFQLATKAVEKTAQFVESKIERDPEVLKDRSIKGYLLKDFPKQVTADFIRFYKPLNAIGFYAVGKTAGFVLKPAWKGVTRLGKKILPSRWTANLEKVFTVGKGSPLKFLESKEKTKLAIAAGQREAETVAKTLTIAPKDLSITLKSGKKIIIKKGKKIPLEHQKIVGKFFRKEFSTDVAKSRLTESLETSKKIAKNVEVEVAFNPTVQSLKEELKQVNKVLGSAQLKAEAMVGKKFITGSGQIEKITKAEKVITKQLGKRKKLSLVSEPVSPVKGNVPSSFIEEESQQILRSVKQVNKATGLKDLSFTKRADLLKKRERLTFALQNKIKEITKDVHLKYEIIDAETFVKPVLGRDKFQIFKQMADEGRVIMDKWSQALIDSGIPKAEVERIIKEHLGKYMRRMYTSKMQKQPGWKVFSLNNLRLRLNALKKRKDLTADVLKRLGEIKEPALPTAVTVKEISESVANAKLFQTVASNPEWTAAHNLTGSMVKMADSPALGALKGKFVIPSIADDINGIVSVKDPSIMFRTYGKMLGAWKYGKVVLNPATHARNMMSNSILLDLSGTGHAKQAILYPRAFVEYLSKGKIYQQALEDGAIGGEFVGTEVAKLKTFYESVTGGHTSKILNILKAPFKAASNVYRGEEQIAKMVKYMDVLDKGGVRKFAAEQAQKTLFDYAKIPTFIEVSKHAAPFITFTYKSIPRIAEAMIERPLKVYKYFAFFNAWNSAARKTLGMNPEQFARENKALPPWLLKSIGGMPANLMMPWRENPTDALKDFKAGKITEAELNAITDQRGRTNWLNLEYILPLGMAPEIAQKGIIKGFISNPFFNIVADIKANKDFAGNKIIPTAASKAETIQAITQYAYRQLAPSFAPGTGIFGEKYSELFKGGYSFEKVMGAKYEKEDFKERVRGMTPVLLDTLAGLKLTPIDVDESEFFRIKKIEQTVQELTIDALKLNTSDVSEEYKEKQMERIFQKMQTLVEEAQ